MDPVNVRIHLYCLCWNEAKIIPYFLRHYRHLVDRFFIFDNGSTDGSLDLLKGDEHIGVTHFDARGNSFVAQERALSDSLWQRSRGRADWVVMIDMDEHLHHADFHAYLARCADRQVTAIQSIGYEMVSDSFPTEPKPLHRVITRGARSLGHDKLCVFNPNAISRTNYGLGRHSAAPVGRVNWPDTPEITMLHYKYLGLDYVMERNGILRTGLRSRDLEMSWGTHYLRARDAVAADIGRIEAMAAAVPGLCATAAAPAALRENEQAVRRSGLFLPAYYLTMNPDVSEAGVDPLMHYHLFGWREGRRPNPHFDPRWYASTYALEIPGPIDPLLDYVRQGERVGRRPCQSFDPGSYRRALGIAAEDSPLLHFLRSEDGWPTDAPHPPTDRPPARALAAAGERQAVA